MENNLTYTRVGDYYIPDLKVTEADSKPIGKYGQMRESYLQKNDEILYNTLFLNGELWPHLLEIDRQAEELLEQLMPKLAKAAGVTESLKSTDPMKWVGLMNNCKAQAEEIIRNELIYS